MGFSKWSNFWNVKEIALLTFHFLFRYFKLNWSRGFLPVGMYMFVALSVCLPRYIYLSISICLPINHSKTHMHTHFICWKKKKNVLQFSDIPSLFFITCFLLCLPFINACFAFMYILHLFRTFFHVPAPTFSRSVHPSLLILFVHNSIPLIFAHGNWETLD